MRIFGKNSILLTKNFDHSFIPLWILVITPILVTLSIPLSFYLYSKNKLILEKIKLKNQKVYKFLLNKWYFDEIYEFIFLLNPFKKQEIFCGNPEIKI